MIGRQAKASNQIGVDGRAETLSQIVESERKIVQVDGIDFVFATGDSKPLQPHVLSRAFDVLQKKAKVPRIRLHDLRHTHATLLFNDGKNIKMISQCLEHSDVGITLSVYAHFA